VIVCRAKGRPELLLVTAMDVTELRRLKAQVRQLSTVNVTFPVQGGDTSVHELVEELAGHLQTVNLTLRPENLEILSKSHVQQFTKSVERIKVLLGELVVKNLNIDEEQ
jgi:hypothetical protein